MKEFYLVPRKIAEQYATSSNENAHKQRWEVDGERKCDNDKNTAGDLKQSREYLMEEEASKGGDKQLSTTTLPPGSISKPRGVIKRIKGGGKKVRVVKRKRKKSPMYLKRAATYARQKVATNPSLDALINNLTPQEGKREYMKSLLHYFENNPNIMWDKHGNLLTPFSGHNIIDIIKDISTKKRYRLADRDKLVFYKMLIDHTDLPIEAVKNKDVAASVYGGGGKRNCSKTILDEWLCYD